MIARRGRTDARLRFELQHGWTAVGSMGGVYEGGLMIERSKVEDIPGVGLDRVKAVSDTRGTCIGVIRTNSLRKSFVQTNHSRSKVSPLTN